MKLFNLRRQTHKTQRIGASTPSRWAEISTDDIRIVVDGCKTNNHLIITVEANGVRYSMTDHLLEIMLGKVAEEFSNNYLNFNVFETDG